MSKFYLSQKALLVLLLLIFSHALYAQITVTGRVTSSEDKSGLPGVNVVEKGTTNGVATDVEGNFKLTVKPGASLDFSSIGFENLEVQVGNQRFINVTLTSEVEALTEVVVIGYGRQEKKDATGSVVALSTKEFNKGVINSPEQLLQGRTPGVQITPSSGEPGAPVNIRIRGTSSPRAGNNPLFVIDGIPLSGNDISAGTEDYGQGVGSARNPLNFVNPDDIESISILKDASAAAIYGSRGANGVVIITTKQGKGGAPLLSFTASGSASTTLKRYDILKASEYVDAAVRAGAKPEVVNEGGSTDWQKEIFRTGITQNYSLAYGGGTEDSRYRFSLGYMDQEGIIKNTGIERLSGRINATHKILENRLQFDIQLAAAQIRDDNAPMGNNAGFEGNLVGAAIQANPTRPVRNPDGSPYQKDQSNRNPVALLEYIDDHTNSIRLLGGLGATWNIADWINVKAMFGYDNSSSVRRVGIDRRLKFAGIENIGRAYIENRYQTNRLLEYTANLNKRFGANRIDAVVGYSYQTFLERGNFTRSDFFPPDTLPYDYVDNIGGVNNKDNKAFLAASNRNLEELQSVFGRVNLNLSERYLLTATLRADGSTKFGKNKKYGYFPSFAAAWRISEEAFTPELFYDLKIRAGWGITGNQEFPGGASQTRSRYDNQGGLVVLNSWNPNLQWEETKQLNVGIDYGFFNGRLVGSVDYFNKAASNLIIRRDYPAPSAFRYRWENLPGKVVNTGVELAFDARVIETDNFTWQVLYNMTYLHNTVKDLGVSISTGAINGQGLSGAYGQRIEDGQPLFSYYLREFAGFNEEGLGTYANNEALAFVGDPLPDFTFGFTNNFTYKRFDASIFFTAATGFDVYNNTANAIFLKGNLRNGRNVTKDVANSSESARNFGEASTRFLEKGDFIRLSNLSLGYNIISGGDKIKNLRVAFTGQNLLLFTKYSGVDPEVSTNKAIDDVPSLGIDYLAYPSARTFTIGLTAGF